MAIVFREKDNNEQSFLNTVHIIFIVKNVYLQFFYNIVAACLVITVCQTNYYNFLDKQVYTWPVLIENAIHALP